MYENVPKHALDTLYHQNCVKTEVWNLNNTVSYECPFSLSLFCFLPNIFLQSSCSIGSPYLCFALEFLIECSIERRPRTSRIQGRELLFLLVRISHISVVIYANYNDNFIMRYG